MSRNRVIRLVLRTAAVALLSFTLLFDPTEVGRNRQTWVREQARRFGLEDTVARQVAYVLNAYSGVAIVLFLASFRFKDPPDVGSGLPRGDTTE